MYCQRKRSDTLQVIQDHAPGRRLSLKRTRNSSSLPCMGWKFYTKNERTKRVGGRHNLKAMVIMTTAVAAANIN